MKLQFLRLVRPEVLACSLRLEYWNSFLMCSFKCFHRVWRGWIVVGILFAVLFFAAGGSSIWVGVEGSRENVATVCTVISQALKSEECAFACGNCGGNTLDPSGCGCQYAAFTDYVTWEYIAQTPNGNQSYTLQTQICSDGDYPFSNGYQTTCWYDANNPSNSQILGGPWFGWVIAGMGVIYILAGISICICVGKCILSKDIEQEERASEETYEKV